MQTTTSAIFEQPSLLIAIACIPFVWPGLQKVTWNPPGIDNWWQRWESLVRIVLALSHLRRNEPAKANALLEGQVVTWARMLPGMRAVVAATLGAGGKINAAASAIRRLPISSLKPEERELIRPYMSGLPVDESAEGRDDADKPEKL